MTTTRYLQNGASLHAHMDVIEATSMAGSHDPDPKWTFTDSLGHTHTWESNTWRWVYDGPEYVFDADGEEYNGPGNYRCYACQSIIEPGTIYTPATNRREYIAGMTSYWIEHPDGQVEELTAEQYGAYAVTS